MDFEALDHEIYYQAYGFDIFGYYNISKEFDFFTSFGVANYKIFNKFDYINPYTDQTEKTTKNDVSTRFGIGVMYTFPGDDISILGQYQYTQLNNELIKNMSEFSVGMESILKIAFLIISSLYPITLSNSATAGYGESIYINT